jgi:hypothetical protein
VLAVAGSTSGRGSVMAARYFREVNARHPL